MSSVWVQASIAQRDIEFNLRLSDGEVLAVLGPNGVGKSTLLSLIAGLVRPDSGRVMLGDRVVTDTATDTFVPPYARGVGLMSQKAMLFPHMSVADNVAFAPRSKRQGRMGAMTIARRWLAAVDAEHLAQRRPNQLSGGQAQRVALARALAAEPEVLLLDEPMSALDVTVAPVLRRLLREVLRDGQRTALIVTHDLLDALAVADRLVIIEKGRVVESGPVRQVLSSPRSAFGARMAGVNLLPGVITDPGCLQTAWSTRILGIGDLPVGTSAVALFAPTAVAIHREPPQGSSPRNVIPAVIGEVDMHGATVRIRAADNPDGSAGPAADITAAAAAELDIAPGQDAFFVVKAQEVQLIAAKASDR